MPGKEFAIGIDIGGTNTVFGFADRKGRILSGGSIKTGLYRRIDDFAAILSEKINSTIAGIGAGAEIAGIGIGAPMGNINKGTIEHAAGLPWRGIVPVARIFTRYTGLPVIVTNDANAAAVGEMVYGGAQGMKDFVLITLGTGLGSGFVVDGRLVYGHDGFAGELGHISAVSGQEGRECGCGKKGCLETYVSATGLRRTLFKIMADSNEPSRLRDLSFRKLDSKSIYNAAKKGDMLALRAFRETGRMLGSALANVTAHTSPEAIFLFGGLAHAGALITEPASKAMEENLLSIYRGRVKILVSQLNERNAAVLGASSLVWSQKKK